MFTCARCGRPIEEYQGSVFHRYEHYHLICAEALGLLDKAQACGYP